MSNNNTPSITGIDEFTLPIARETEKAILGIFFLDEQAIKKAQSMGLMPKLFASPSHRIIFEAILEAQARGWTIDPRTLSDYLESQHQLEKIGGRASLAELIDGSVPQSDKLSSLIRQLEAVQYKRETATFALKLANQACNGASPLDITQALDRFPRASTDDKPILQTWRQLAAQDLKQGDTIIYELERGEMGLLAAVTNVGKSTLLRNLMLCLASGREFPPIAAKRTPRRVLLLDFETRSEKLQRDIRTMLKDFSEDERKRVDENLAFVCDEDINEEPLCLSYPLHLNFVRKEALAFKPDLVIVDTVSAAFSMRDENNNAEVNSQICKPLVKLARDLNTAILIAHHIGKSGSEDGRAAEKAYRARGASSFGAFPSLILNLTQDNHDQDRVTLNFAKVKGNRLADHTFQLDGEARWFHLSGAAAITLPTAYDCVLDLMADGHIRTKQEIEDTFKGRYAVTAIKDALQNAKAKGKLTQSKRGTYQLAESVKGLI